MIDDTHNPSDQPLGNNTSACAHAHCGCASATKPELPTFEQLTPESLLIKMKSNPAQLRAVRKLAENFALSAGCSMEATEHVGLVLNEALANVIRHQYHNDLDQPIHVTVEKAPRELWISIRDWGVRFDPSQLPSKDLSGTHLSPGGLGLVCIRRLMDDVSYEQLPDGMRLRLGKRL
jgi:serine/threonine-protein kinase RsbW